LFPNTFNKIKQ